MARIFKRFFGKKAFERNTKTSVFSIGEKINDLARNKHVGLSSIIEIENKIVNSNLSEHDKRFFRERIRGLILRAKK